MALDLWSEEILTLAEASKLLPQCGGKHPSLPTVWRWCRMGIRGVHLEYIRVGRRMMTSKAALARFFQMLAESDAIMAKEVELRRQQSAEAVSAWIRDKFPKRVSNATRAAQLREANRILDEAGI